MDVSRELTNVETVNLSNEHSKQANQNRIFMHLLFKAKLKHWNQNISLY